jgi:hypothetical protein
VTSKELPRAVITTVVMGLFAFAYAYNPSDEMMKGALIAAFSLAVSYWLGSSKGSSDKADQLERQAEGPSGSPGDPIAVEGATAPGKPVSVQEKSKKP